MKSEKFFKWVWNINGLVLLIGLIITILVVGYNLASFLFKSNTQMDHQALNLAEDEKQQEKWKLGYPRKVADSDYYYIPLESEKRSVDIKPESAVYESFGSGSYKYNPTRSKNILFINDKTNQAKWLFNTTDQLIIEFGALSNYKEFDTRAYMEQQVDTPRGVSYEVIKNDSNNDKRLDGKDKRTFALSKIDGSNYTEVISGYNRIVESNLNAEGNLFVVFINNNEVYSMLIDLDTFKVISKSMLPKVGA
ncbi:MULTISPECIES: hypothetical protein [Pseudoalteromonas]|jgi:hypothetical protein|uniref:hypothetical protein n=1 Tax=Pseudoalteromonas TaxID=53246 RepID=UPI0009503385|nr:MULTISPECIES: hypothetical protein [Pseudoalteromonas]MAE01327.1 hypothetical protein [Pseudoalteromonas sp.]QLJ09026.1 hypothetical protein GZH31_03985 [Pseudoalteromonas sp. JSTW]QMW15256.1 hypothetical protein H3302_03880 [Pseudoalteromonas sp. MT33b]|tara:strand:+ start:8736 stop:9485 length:750 start_codon:yes stop_codon:yes gene_type:complete